MPRILVVDDEPDICELIADILGDEGFQVDIAHNGNEGRTMFHERQPSLVLLDIWMPGIDGITLLKEWLQENPNCRIIMMSGHGNVETAVEATRLGAFDYIEKPLSMGKLVLAVKNALGEQGAATATRPLSGDLQPVGRSESTKRVKENIKQTAMSTKHILISGEPGSGRSFWARVLHNESPRKHSPLITVQGKLLTDANWREILFGYAGSDHEQGLLSKSSGSSLLITDIHMVSPDVQQQIVGVIEKGRYMHVDGVQPVALNTRLLFTQDNRSDVFARPQNTTQRDFWFTLLEIPPLREHNSDIPDLIQYFINRYGSEQGLPFKHFSVAAQNRLRYYQWPGNISELRSVIKQLLMQAQSDEVSDEDVENVLAANHRLTEENSLQQYFNMPLREAREQFERAYFRHHIQRERGNVTKLAKVSGMERTHLYRKMRNLGINIKHEKSNK